MVRVATTVAFCAFTLFVVESGHAGKKGFADKPGGGANDPRIAVFASKQPDDGKLGKMLYPDDASYDARGSYAYAPMDAQMGTLGVAPLTELPASLNNDGSLQCAWVALRFPFDLTSKKVKKTVFGSGPAAYANSFLDTDIEILDENGARIPVLPVIAGKDPFGNDLSQHAAFPEFLDEQGNDIPLAPDVLLLLADDGDAVLEAETNFGAAANDLKNAGVREIRIRVERVGGIEIHGSWVIRVGSAFIAPSFHILSVDATDPKKPTSFSGGDPVILKQSDFVLRFSHPVEPLSVGINKSLATALGVEFSKNVAVTVLPDSPSGVFPGGDPLAPNLLLAALGSGEVLGFQARPINPNNLSEYVITPLKKLPAGTLRFKVFDPPSNMICYEQKMVESGPTSLFGEFLPASAEFEFAVKK